MVDRSESKPLDCFSYLSAPNSSLYAVILSVFADARRDFRLNLRATEVLEAVKLSSNVSLPGESELDAALLQLCTWGNLESFSDQSQAATLEEFYRRHLYYQMTGEGVAALRAIELFHELVETPASLQSTALSAVRDRLAELISLAKAQEHEHAPPFDAAKASSLLESLFSELENLTAQAQEFFRGLQATVELREISVGAFMNFKERLVHYLERFLSQTITVSGEAETMLRSVDHMLIDAMMDSVARFRTADDFDVSEDRVIKVRDSLSERWRGVCAWFVGDSFVGDSFVGDSLVADSGQVSQADELRGLARSGIREVAAAASRIQRASGGVLDRSADYQALAIRFAACADDAEAHRLWRVAFCLSPARHLTVSDETLAQRDQTPIPPSTSWQGSPPLRIAPTLRRTGRVAKAGATRKIVDNRQQLAQLAETNRREAEQFAKARRELVTERIRLSEFGEIGAEAFPLLLDLIGEALSQRTESDTKVEAVISDGSMRIQMQALPSSSDRCCLNTSFGTFSGPDFWITIEDETGSL